MSDQRYSSIGGEGCHNCGKIYKMWYHIPDRLWQAVTGQKEGLLCPSCFDQLAAVHGFTLVWKVEAHALEKNEETREILGYE